MSVKSAQGALNYAVHPELLKLYLGFAVAWGLWFFAQSVPRFPYAVYLHWLQDLITALLAGLSILILVITIVAIAHKVISDSFA